MKRLFMLHSRHARKTGDKILTADSGLSPISSQSLISTRSVGIDLSQRFYRPVSQLETKSTKNKYDRFQILCDPDGHLAEPKFSIAFCLSTIPPAGAHQDDLLCTFSQEACCKVMTKLNQHQSPVVRRLIHQNAFLSSEIDDPPSTMWAKVGLTLNREHILLSRWECLGLFPKLLWYSNMKKIASVLDKVMFRERSTFPSSQGDCLFCVDGSEQIEKIT
jgi:hypothetical protein